MERQIYGKSGLLMLDPRVEAVEKHEKPDEKETPIPVAESVRQYPGVLYLFNAEIN